MSRVCAVFLLALSVSAAACSASARVVAVPFTDRSIRIDGRLTEAAWAKAGRIPSFEHYTRSAEIRNQTEVLLLYDRSALLIAYRCGESNMSALKADVTAHDGAVWDDDAADIFLDPKADRASFHQFIANTVGGRYDALGSDCYGFNPRWESKAQTGKDGWTLEVRIPFSEIGVACPAPGDLWLGNFCREEQPSKELSCWNATMSGFDAPGAFGEIVFGSLAEKARRDVGRLRPQLAAKGMESARLDAASGLVPKVGEMSVEAYTEVQAALLAVEAALAGARIAARRAAMGNPDYLVWEISPWKHFSTGEDAAGVDRQTDRLDVLALVGQTESRALMVTNLTDETLSARLVLDGTPRGTVDILLPTFVRTADGRPFPDALVPPDPIGQIVVPSGETRQIWLNFRASRAGKHEGTLTISPLTGSKTDTQVKLSLEAVAPPGELPKPTAFTWDYLGDAEDRGLVDQYIRTMVDHGISVFWVSGLRYMPRPKADDQGSLQEPTDWSRFREQVKLKWKPGRKLYLSVDVWEKASERPLYNGKFDSPGWRIAFKTIIGEMVGVLGEMGLSCDDYWINPVDESIDERYLAIARLIKEVDPRIQIISDSIGASLDEVRAADEVTDHWVPHFRAFRADSSRESISYLKANGKPLGFYFYSEGANEKAQDPYNHYLWKLWYAWSLGLDGMIGYWTATQSYGDPWNRHQTDAHYDPSLFYPGNDCVVSGRRWEAWRRGIEDLALLRLCESAGVNGDVISRAVESVLGAPTDPDRAAMAREELIRGLDKKH